MNYKKSFIVAGMIASAVILTGAADDINKKPPVEVTYVVRAGDTLRDISGMYLKKNTYGPRYILEFESGIKELNPWLNTPERQYGGLILPGDELRINYWVKAEEK